MEELGRILRLEELGATHDPRVFARSSVRSATPSRAPPPPRASTRTRAARRRARWERCEPIRAGRAPAAANAAAIRRRWGPERRVTTEPPPPPALGVFFLQYRTAGCVVFDRARYRSRPLFSRPPAVIGRSNGRIARAGRRWAAARFARPRALRSLVGFPNVLPVFVGRSSPPTARFPRCARGALLPRI